MNWIKDHHRTWRISILALLLVAFLGPWTLERLYIPSEYECSAPYIRLEGDFCGSPQPGISLFFWLSSGLTTGLITGEFVNSERIREFLFISLFLLLPVLPILSTLLLIPGRDHRRRQIFTIIAWVLAIGFGIFWGLINHPKLYWIVWGIWLYIVLAISALILEILVILSSRKDPDVLTDVESVLR